MVVGAVCFGVARARETKHARSQVGQLEKFKWLKGKRETERDSENVKM